MPVATLRTMRSATSAKPTPRSGASRSARARVTRPPPSAWASSTPAMMIASTNCSSAMPVPAAALKSHLPASLSIGLACFTASCRLSDASCQNR
jgi:hypothetical protein